MWVLLVFAMGMYQPYNPSMISQEFSTRERCEDAGQHFVEQIHGAYQIAETRAVFLCRMK